MATSEDLCFKLPDGNDPVDYRYVLLRDGEVFEMIEEDRTDFGHTMADGLDITSRPIVSVYIFTFKYIRIAMNCLTLIPLLRSGKRPFYNQTFRHRCHCLWQCRRECGRRGNRYML